MHVGTLKVNKWMIVRAILIVIVLMAVIMMTVIMIEEGDIESLKGRSEEEARRKMGRKMVIN